MLLRTAGAGVQIPYALKDRKGQDMTVTQTDRDAMKAVQLDFLVAGAQGYKDAWRRGEEAFAKHREDAERPLLERIEALEAALKEYIGGCTNEECIYCINARQALGETQ